MSITRLFLFLAAVVLSCPAMPAVRRLVVIKADGVPAGVMDSLVRQVDPATGKSVLPWIDHVFYRHGARVSNFYTRGISLSAPAWSMLDTGQHLQIRGNVEYDRYTFRAYDYLNFFPFYVRYALSHRVDMPAVEVLDDIGTPLLIDRFPYRDRYQGFQLLQRGVRWRTLEQGLRRYFSDRSVRELFDEWHVGMELRSSIGNQTERELIAKLYDPNVRYLDIFTGDYDHVAHLVRGVQSQRRVLEELDALVGRLWTAIKAAPLASETVLILVSDHGMNTDPAIYSQGYNLVDWFRSPAGGAHHVVTNRHPMQDYKLRGLDPFVSRVVTPSENSPYLRDQAQQYPTVLLDLDGNERASVYLRNNDLNRLHVLLRQLSRRELPAQLRAPTARAVQQLIETHRLEWQRTVESLSEELGAVHRAIERWQAEAAAQPKKWPQEARDSGRDKDARRVIARIAEWDEAERGYTEYIHSLQALLAFHCDRCEIGPETISRIIPPRAMGERNSIASLRHHVVSAVPAGLSLNREGELDSERSFRTIDYLAALKQLSVRNNTQAGLSASPVDFIAIRVPRSALADLPPEQQSTGDAVWLYRGENEQALLLRREEAGREPTILYLPVAQLTQTPDGVVHWAAREFGPGLPLEIWEDPKFNIPADQRAAWMACWHSEREWLSAIHQTRYSIAVIGLLEHFGPVQVGAVPMPPGTNGADAELLTRWQARRRSLVEPDLLVLANDHWNFNVRGFNPGGNHGSFFRPSTHSVLLLSGGGIATQEIAEPYDSLNLMPTLVRLLGWPAEGYPGKPMPLSTDQK